MSGSEDITRTLYSGSRQPGPVVTYDFLSQPNFADTAQPYGWPVLSWASLPDFARDFVRGLLTQVSHFVHLDFQEQPGLGDINIGSFDLIGANGYTWTPGGTFNDLFVDRYLSPTLTEYVLTHEIGHRLGLDHMPMQFGLNGQAATDVHRSVMWAVSNDASIAGWGGFYGTDDIIALRTIYGARYDHATTEGQVALLYGAAFGRQPDQDGLAVQVDATAHGVSMDQLASNFIASAEFASRYGAAPSDAAFVTALYQNIFGRAPDSTGVAVQMEALSHGEARSTMLIGFAVSAENIAHGESLGWLV